MMTSSAIQIAFGAAGAALAVGIGVYFGVGPSASVLAAGLGAGAGVSAGLLWRRKAPGRHPATTSAPFLSDAPAELNRILDHLPVAILLIDNDLRIRRMNAAGTSLFGETPPGQHLVATIRSPDLIEAVETSLRDGHPQALPFTLRRAKEDRALFAHIRTITTPEEQPAVFMLLEDQTRMRRVEVMRHDFVANASHELKTPLASIIGFIETLQGPAKDDDAARERFLDIMSVQAERMKRLVEDLLSLNRIELNAHIRPTGKVDLSALAHEAAAALVPLATDAGASILVETPKQGLNITGDRDQLTQLLTNLIDNAIKYGGNGAEVRIGLAKPAPEWPGMIGLEVADTGPGIARDHLPRLTERFYRVSATQSRAVGGTGLGLAIAKHILQRHRGELAVRSTPGEGTTFTIWLPKESDSAL